MECLSTQHKAECNLVMNRKTIHSYDLLLQDAFFTVGEGKSFLAIIGKYLYPMKYLRLMRVLKIEAKQGEKYVP